MRRCALHSFFVSTRSPPQSLHLFFFEHVSGIFRSFAREDAGNAASVLWRWLSCLCHPSLELPLSWCIIEPLNQLPLSLSPSSFPVRDRASEPRPKGKKEKKKKRETDREVKVTSLSLCYLHLRCYGIAPRGVEQQRMVCGHSCQPLTVHHVKLVIICSLKRCPRPRSDRGGEGRETAHRRTLKAGCLCQGGKSPSWRPGKHYGGLYRHRLLRHIQKWSDKFAWRRDGRQRRMFFVTSVTDATMA